MGKQGGGHTRYRSQSRGRKPAKEYVSCAQCGYGWNFKSNSWCYQCRRAIQPSSEGSQPRPDGAWERGPPQQRPKALEDVGVDDLLKQLESRLDSSHSDAITDLKAKLGTHQPTTADKTELLEGAVSAASVRLRRAERAFKNCCTREAEAVDWVTVCKENTASAAIEQLQAREALDAALRDTQAKAGLRAEPEAPPDAGTALDISKILGGADIDFLDGDLFDMADLDLEQSQIDQFVALKKDIAAQIQQAVKDKFGQGASSLAAKKEELRKLRESCKKKRRIEAQDQDVPDPVAAAPAAVASSASTPGPVPAPAPDPPKDTKSKVAAAAAEIERAALAKAAGKGRRAGAPAAKAQP